MLETWKHNLIQQNKSTSTKCQWQQHKHRVSKGSASTCCLAVVWSKQFIEAVSFEGKQQKNVYWLLQKIEFLANKKKYVTGKATEQIDNWKRNIQANFSIFQLSLPNFFTAIPTNPIPQTGLPVLHFAKWPFQRCTLQDDAPLCFTLLCDQKRREKGSPHHVKTGEGSFSRENHVRKTNADWIVFLCLKYYLLWTESDSKLLFFLGKGWVIDMTMTWQWRVGGSISILSVQVSFTLTSGLRATRAKTDARRSFIFWSGLKEWRGLVVTFLFYRVSANVIWFCAVASICGHARSGVNRTQLWGCVCGFAVGLRYFVW